MATFHLEVLSLDGPEFEGEVERIIVRTQNGDVAILANHTNYCTAIGMGTAKVVLADGTVRRAACIGGMLTMLNNECRVLPTTWEFSDDIDLERANKAKQVAEERIEKAKSEQERVRAEAKLYRALVRIQTVGR